MENSAHPSQIIAFHLNPIRIRLAYNSPPLQYAIIQNLTTFYMGSSQRDLSNSQRNLWDQNLGW